ENSVSFTFSTRMALVGLASMSFGIWSTRTSSLMRTRKPALSMAATNSGSDCCMVCIPLWRNASGVGGRDFAFLHVGPEMMQHHAPERVALVEVALLVRPAGMGEGDLHAAVRRLAEIEGDGRAGRVARSRGALPCHLVIVLHGDLPDEGRTVRIFQRPLRADAAAAGNVG